MRILVLVAMSLAVAGAALAQTEDCEASAKGKAGEVIVVQQVDAKTRKPMGPVTLTWGLERTGGYSSETAGVSRPALMMDFRVGADGKFVGPAAVFVTITRYWDQKTGKAQSLNGIRVRVKHKMGSGEKDGPPVIWPATDPGKGQAELTKNLRGQWPDNLWIELIDAKDNVLADTVFDLTQRGAAETLSRSVVADAAAKCGVG